MENKCTNNICEKDLEKLLELAGQSDKAKTDFLSRMSHEIRTPLNAIMGMTHIAEGTSDIAKIRTCLSKINIASQHLLSIVNDILDMSKIESGKLDIQKSEFYLEKTLMDICSMIIVKSDEKHQNLNITVGRDVPRKFLGDEFRLSQVLINLLSNAVKFTPENGDIKIRVDLKKLNNDMADLEFAVTDSGIGISAEQQTKLFTMFEQANGTISRKYGGTGLGLAICKSIVELMEGSIRVESEEGSGSSFIFDIRLPVLHDENEPQVNPCLIPEDANILFVDDNFETREYFELLMNEYKIAVQTAESGEKAIRLFEDAINERKPFTAVFIDWRMPGMDGIETIRRIKKRWGEQTVVVLISISEYISIEKEASEVGVFKFLPKPLLPYSVISTICEIAGDPGKEIIVEKKQYMPNLTGKTILIAEDVEINRVIISAFLEDSHASVEYAFDGAEAVEKFRRNFDKYDLILMDVIMPVMNGYDATKTIRAMDVPRAKSIPVIAMTASVFREDIELCMASGMNGHLGKPINENALINKLYEIFIEKESVDMENNIDRENCGKIKSNETESHVNDPMRYLPYIDETDGLSRIRGNKKLYGNMLKSFSNNKKLYSDLIEKAKEGDIPETQYIAHTIKGVAGNLSLKALFETIVPFEQKLKQNELDAAIIPKLEEIIGKTIAAIDGLLLDYSAEANN